MGKMFAEGDISAKELGWVSLDPKVDREIREAARSILAHEWRVPVNRATLPGQSGPEVIYGSRYLQKMERVNFAAAIGLIGFAAGALFITLFNSSGYMLAGKASVLELLAAAIIVAAGLWMVYRATGTYYKTYKNYGKGREGESTVVERMLGVLDGRWIVFRNLQLGKGEDDIDIVLIGPGQVWAVEVKTYSQGTKVASSYQAKRRSLGKRSVKGRRPPDAQAFDKAMRLRTLLKQKGLADRYVRAAVAFPEFSPSDFTPRDDVAIWHRIDLDQYLYQLRATPGTLSQEDRSIAIVLRTLADSR
jgi:hypothetical protein